MPIKPPQPYRNADGHVFMTINGRPHACSVHHPEDIATSPRSLCYTRLTPVENPDGRVAVSKRITYYEAAREFMYGLCRVIPVGVGIVSVGWITPDRDLYSMFSYPPGALHDRELFTETFIRWVYISSLLSNDVQAVADELHDMLYPDDQSDPMTRVDATFAAAIHIGLCPMLFSVPKGTLYWCPSSRLADASGVVAAIDESPKAEHFIDGIIPPMRQAYWADEGHTHE